MMKATNIGKKVGILASILLLAIGSIVAFGFIILGPPSKVDFKQTTHADDANAKTQGYVANAATLNADHQEMLNAIDRITVFHDNGKIDDATFNNGIAAVVNIYSNAFYDWAMGKFGERQWYTTEHNQMKAQIAELRNNYKLTDDTSALRDSKSNTLTEIELIIQAYNEALALTKQTKFQGVAAHKNRIADAKAFREHSYLANCTALANALDAYPQHLCKTHATSIWSDINSLKYYMEREAEFNVQKSNCEQRVAEFKGISGYGNVTQRANEMYDTINAIQKRANAIWRKQAETNAYYY